MEKLNLAQKNYVVKRINTLAREKIMKLLENNKAGFGFYIDRNGVVTYPKYKSCNPSLTNEILAQAIIDGEIRLRSAKDTIKALKDKLKGTDFYSLGNELFINPTSRKSYEQKYVKEIMEEREALKARVKEVENAAAALKDKVMLNGNVAVEEIKKFESREF